MLVDPSEPVFLGVAVLVGGVVALLVTLLARLRRSGRELERLNWRYLNVLEATADGIIGVQPDGRIAVVNPAAEELTGRDRQWLLGLDVSEVLALGDVTANLHDLIADLPVGHDHSDRDARVLRPDGDRVAVHVRLATLDHGGRRAGGVLTIRDLREELRSAATLERSERRARQIIETAGDAYIALDASGVVTGWNAAATATFGWSAEEAVGRELTDLIIPEAQAEAHRAGLRRYLRTRSSDVLGRRLELVGRRRDGADVPIEVVIWVVDDAADDVRFSAFLRDISERRAAEEALRESESRLRQAEELAELGSWEWDVQSGQLTWSPGSFVLNDRDPDEFVPTFEGWLETVYPDDREKVLAAVNGALEQGERYEVEFRNVHRDGSIHLVHTVGAVERDDLGQPRKVIGTARDVTEERLVEKLKDEFTAIASHELRTPLTSVHAALTLMDAGATGELPPEAAKMVAVASRNTQRLIRLINDLLDVERLTAGKVQLCIDTLELPELLHEVADSLRGMADEAGVTLEVDAPSSLTAEVDGDRLVQVVTNLVGNAIKFAPAGTAVTVSARQRGPGEVVLTVRDHGPGIPAEELAHVFDRFRQVPGTGTSSGSGLGLAIARELVDLHGGTIRLHSEGAGLGTTAVVVLPRAQVRENDSEATDDDRYDQVG